MEDTEHEGGFLARWSERKQAARQGARLPADPPLQATAVPAAAEGASGPGPEPPAERILTDVDMPPLDSLDGHSDYSGFLSRGVSPALRRQALAHLFRSPHLNLATGLDDFPEDYTRFEALGELITADIRHQAEVAVRRLAAQQELQVVEPEVVDTAARCAVPAPTPALTGPGAAAPAETGQPAALTDAQAVQASAPKHREDLV
jgi:hypothetical protein